MSEVRSPVKILRIYLRLTLVIEAIVNGSLSTLEQPILPTQQT